MEISKYCSVCGNGVVAQAVICPKCGSPVAPMQKSTMQGDKSKTVAIILAIFLGAWSWLYTARADAPKFWAFVGASVVPAMLLWISSQSQFNYSWFLNYLLSGLAALVLLNLWPVINAIVRPASFYAQYETQVYSLRRLPYLLGAGFVFVSVTLTVLAIFDLVPECIRFMGLFVLPLYAAGLTLMFIAIGKSKSAPKATS